MCACGLLVLCQHAELGAELPSSPREKQAAGELWAHLSTIYRFLFTDCQQVQLAVPQTVSECAQRGDPHER